MGLSSFFLISQLDYRYLLPIAKVFYITSSGTNGSVTEGVQQPYVISSVTGIVEANGINLAVSAYPNPTTDFLALSVNNFNNSKLYFKLYDMNGKLLENKSIEGNETSIAMGNLIPATYFLKVFNNQKELKTFKIIKN